MLSFYYMTTGSCICIVQSDILARISLNIGDDNRTYNDIKRTLHFKSYA